MRVLVWGVNYHPEQVGIAPYNKALCEFLARAGHEVEMLTTFAYYPMWKKTAGDQRRLYRTDLIRGVRVRRCWHFVPRRPSGLRRILHEASFVLSSMPRALLLPRPDVIVTVSPPLLLGAAATLLGWLKKTPHVLHIQDLQPDAAVGLGMLDRKWLIALLRRLEAFNYRTAAAVSVISHGMLRLLQERGVQRLVLFPNWITTRGTPPRPGAFREKRGIPPDEFLFLYSGNIGMKQGLDKIVEAAARVKEVRLVICGDGAARPALEQLIAARAAANVTLLPLQPDDDYLGMMADADVCIVSQRPGSGAAFFPSKLLSCASLGKPVLAVAGPESEVARVVIEEALGEWVAPDDIDAVAAAMRALTSARPALAQYALNGKQFATRFEAEKVLRHFEQTLKDLASPAPVRP